MNKSIVSILLFSSAAAFANEAADDLSNRTAFVGERTRAEVQADVTKARAAGTLGASEYARNAQPAIQSSRSRSAVRAEAAQASRIRVIDALI